MEFWNHILNQSVMAQSGWIFWCGHTTRAFRFTRRQPRKCSRLVDLSKQPNSADWTLSPTITERYQSM